MRALLFSNQAFAVPSLTSLERLFRLRTSSKQKQLLMSLKKKMTKRSLFRRHGNTVKSIQISDEQALADSILRSQMITLGSIIGMKLLTGSYTFRRGNGQALDNSSRWTMCRLERDSLGD